MFNEQRSTQRKVVKVKALVALEGGAAVAARTVDISASGMCVSVADPMAVGASAQVRFDLLVEGRPNTIQVKSRATYCILSGNEFKVGLTFLNLDLSSMTTLAKFLR